MYVTTQRTIVCVTATHVERNHTVNINYLNKENRRENKLILVLLLLVILFVGCESLTNYDACIEDEDCRKEIAQLQHGVSTQTTSALQATTVSSSTAVVVGSAAGGLIAILFAIKKGKKLRKDKK